MMIPQQTESRSSAHSRGGLAATIAAVSRRPADPGAAVTGAVSLAMGEPGSGTPDRVVDAAVAALHAGRTRYAPLSGEPDLRSALARWLGGRGAAPVDPAEIVLCHGASAALAATILAVVRPGDRVLVPEPTYSLYADHIAMAGGECRWVAPTDRMRIDLDAVRAEAAGAVALILCNPANPTGAVLHGDELASLARLIEEYPALTIIVDEAYSDIVFDDRVFRSALALPRNRTVVIGTFSKSFAMTGWRLGYAVSDAGTAAGIGLVHRTVNGALNTFVQDAAIEALRIPAAQLAELATDYQERRDLVSRFLDGVPGVTCPEPEGAFYAFPRVHTAMSSDDLVRRFAAGGVLVRSGTEYGPSGEGHVRLSFATDDASLRLGLQRFADVVAQIQHEENLQEE